MVDEIVIGEEEVDRLYDRLHREAEAGGYHLNPDRFFTRELVRGLLVNEKRYGYWACPCRLASGEKSQDLDIVCPCDYRDPDLAEHGSCYCALYVALEILQGKKSASSIPERRPPAAEREKAAGLPQRVPSAGVVVPLPVWRCKVCGYLCGREDPPLVCPICKAGKDRFERFL